MGIHLKNLQVLVDSGLAQFDCAIVHSFRHYDPSIAR